MAIKLTNQYSYTGKGPLDSKSLVKTYNDLISPSTWTVDGNIVAYNGMIVAVWLDKTTPENNGIYYLFDSSITSTRQSPDVTSGDNWHKLSGDVDLSGIQEVIDVLEDRVDTIENELNQDHIHTYGYKRVLPEKGQLNHFYFITDEKRTYVYTTQGYVPLADQFDTVDDDNDESTPAVRIIFGGSAD